MRQKTRSGFLALWQGEWFAMGDIGSDGKRERFVVGAFNEEHRHGCPARQPSSRETVYTVDHRHSAPMHNDWRQVFQNLRQTRNMKRIRFGQPW
jgi:hypothetical protein